MQNPWKSGQNLKPKTNWVDCLLKLNFLHGFKQDPEAHNIQNVQDRFQNYSTYELGKSQLSHTHTHTQKTQILKWMELLRILEKIENINEFLL